jgi:hypothetical protein
MKLQWQVSGVHYDPHRQKEPVALIDGKINVKGLPVAVYNLKAIAKIALRALEALIADVKRRRG